MQQSTTTRAQAQSSPCCSGSARVLPSVCRTGGARRRLLVQASGQGLGASGPRVDQGSSSHRPHHPLAHGSAHDVSCGAVLVAERVAVETLQKPAPAIATPPRPAGIDAPRPVPTETVDVAVCGADLPGLAAALAVCTAAPEINCVMYDAAAEPPDVCDAGVLLSVNGLRALKSLSPEAYARVVNGMGTPIHESLWFDLEGELVRRAPMGQPSAATPLGGARRARRRSSSAAAAPHRSEPDPAAPPLMVGLHELREALADALPQEVEIYGRHHLRAAERSPAGGCQLGFAAGPSLSARALRSVQAGLVVGAEGPSSQVKALQFDADPEAASSAAPLEPAAPTAAAAAASASAGRVVWRGRFTLRPRDPDFALLRRFTTASRTWVDLRAPRGGERWASLSPAGPNTYVWTASCPVGLLAGRGLTAEAVPGGASPYWRCVAMFEDFPQELFAALRNSTASAVVEYGAGAASSAAAAPAAASLAAPWRWTSGAGAALVGTAVYGTLPADDATSTAANLALEDAAVLGACVRQYGVGQRALTEYARLRAKRVSALLALPTSSLERARLRDSPFLPSAAVPAPAAAAAAPEVAAVAAATAVVPEPSVPTAAATGVNAGPAAAAVTAEPVVVAAAPSTVAEATVPAAMPPAAAPGADFGRPSGGASRVPPGAQEPAASPADLPSLSRPSGGAGRGAPGAADAGPEAAPASAAAAAEAVPPPAPAPVATPAPAPAPAPLPFVAESTPRLVWSALLSTPYGVPAAAEAKADTPARTLPLPRADSATVPAAPSSPARPYCTLESPSLVWAALLGLSAATSTAPPPADTLLPKPKPSPKAKALTAAPAAAAEAASATTATAAVAPVKPPRGDKKRDRNQKPPTAPPSSSSAATATPAAAAATPASPQKPKQPKRAASVKPSTSKPPMTARKAVGRAAAAAKAAATTGATVAAAAVLGHMGHDPAHVWHVQASVAQFWDQLDHLGTLSSNSLSSVDLI
ncbi:hypothetical protein HYH03_005370 [Edaphochlamys debaryana]|uniref:Uncharacterized protein n=1 Tax=Edaphochlamys debaryana TaxID=47281 RepID=A0A835Y539_9CHLO|nr:hypothetical protein HYH03_005370 [Edaphochlamys debaryana]|eukprot:KAG2496547.1 hypothetical protein HYH03_005370 [Edaphochlamys debaryana]